METNVSNHKGPERVYSTKGGEWGSEGMPPSDPVAPLAPLAAEEMVEPVAEDEEVSPGFKGWFNLFGVGDWSLRAYQC